MKDWPYDMVDYVTTVVRTITGPMQAHLRWEVLENGTPRFYLLAAEWFDKGAIKDGIETITMRNMRDLVNACTAVGAEWGPALFVSRNRGINVSKAFYDKIKADATAEREFRLAEEWRK